MIKYKITTVEEAKRFVKTAMEMPCRVTVVSGEYKVDGKSIMGIFSIDLSKPFEIDVDSQYREGFEDFANG